LDATVQIRQADQRRHQRHAVDGAARRRQLERKRQEEQPGMLEQPLVPRQLAQRLDVDAAREEAVSLRRVAREQTLELGRRQSLDVVLEEFA
jgi:hypothetical protein